MSAPEIDTLADYSEGEKDGSPWWTASLRYEGAELIVTGYRGGYTCSWESDSDIDEIVSTIEPWCKIKGRLEVSKSGAGSRTRDLSKQDGYIGLYDLSEFQRVELEASNFNVYWTDIGGDPDEKDYMLGKQVKVDVQEVPGNAYSPFLEPVRRLHPMHSGKDIPAEVSRKLIPDAEKFLKSLAGD